MFDDRSLAGELAAVREAHAPDALVFDVESDFETLKPAVAENLALVVERFEPSDYRLEWVPEDAPRALHRLAGGEFTVGAPGDGGVAWTRQTVPPCVFVKPRLAGSPESFVEFLLAEALVQVGLDAPEHFLGFFEESYRELDAAVPLGPVEVYQLAAALYDAHLGLRTREVFGGWADGSGPDGVAAPDLHAAWRDAGDRLAPRLDSIGREVARGETGFAAAAELACSAVKHGCDLPAPFAALDTAAYRDHGAPYAVRWAAKTFEKLDE